MSQFQTDDGIAHCHWYLTQNFQFHFQSRFLSQWLTHSASITLEQISLFRSTSRFYQVLCMLIHGSHPQLLNPDWQRADCTSRTGGNPCCPKALRPLLKPVGVKPCPGWCPPHKVQVTGSWGDGIWVEMTGPEGSSLVSVHIPGSGRILQSQRWLVRPKKGFQEGQTENQLRIWFYLRKSHSSFLSFFPPLPSFFLRQFKFLEVDLASGKQAA